MWVFYGNHMKVSGQREKKKERETVKDSKRLGARERERRIERLSESKKRIWVVYVWQFVFFIFFSPLSLVILEHGVLTSPVPSVKLNPRNPRLIPWSKCYVKRHIFI